jgi:hypothetical protein
MTPEQRTAIIYSHTALQDYQKFLELWACNRLDEVRLIVDIGAEIEELRRTTAGLEQTFPHVNPGLQDLD